MKTDDTIECIVCGVALDNWVYKDNEVHQIGGLHFRTYGHMGLPFLTRWEQAKHLTLRFVIYV